ncbi:MAG: hypothetical protein HFH55_09170 [Lachnospiraceae bacterium]|nr:hypothetical protein [Lachnospiraceae bacterium]
MNHLWAFMILLGIIYGSITGNLQGAADAALSSAQEAVQLSLTMCGIMALWVGLMEIAKDAGLIDRIKESIDPEMCTFLIINISSLQLIPVNVIAYRSQYGSVDPAAIVGPGIAATAVSTVVAVVYCKMMDGKRGG